MLSDASLVSSAQAQERQIIDMHLHALPIDVFPARFDSLAGYERPGSARKVMRQTIDQLKRFNISTAVTSGQRDLLAAYKRAAPDRIIRSQWVPDGLTGDTLRAYLDSLSVWYEEGRFRVIGEVLTQYSGIAPDDAILDPLWTFAEEEGVPVGIHIGPTTTNALPGYTPLAMESVLAEHPDLKVYVMHAGYPKLEDMIDLLSEHPQVYVELAGVLFFEPETDSHRYLQGLVEAGHADRIMFGSDQQVWPQSIDESIQVIEHADFLTAEQKRAIFYENAARFLGRENTNDL